VFLASERVEPELMDWATAFFGCPVIDNWWQTEAGWPIASNTLGAGLLPIKTGSVARPLPGWQIEIVDDAGRVLPPESRGNVVVRLPLPPGAVRTLSRDDDRFVATYLKRFPGYYDTSDAGRLDVDGYLWIAGRTDDIINVGGDSLSGLDLEPLLAAHPDVERCAVVAGPDPFFTEVPVAFVVARPGSELTRTALAEALRELVVERVGAWTRLRRFVFLESLPLTPSKKIKRSVLRRLLATVPGTSPTDDPELAALEDLSLPVGSARD
jgi:propionyl-CoA synthetase